MPLPLVISLIGLSLLAAGLGVYWLVVLGHVIRTARRVPTARAGLALDGAMEGAASVCVVVPAHNEQGAIAGVAEAVRGQDYSQVRMVFALDRCTDQTRQTLEAALEKDARAEIVEIGTCPGDWAGKVHALWRGVQDSRGAREADILLFIDADTRPAKECVRACVNLLRSRRLAMVSLLSTMTGRRWFDRFVEPAAGIELIRQYPLERSNDPDSSTRRAFANGQFIMITREAYDTIGGHERVRHALLEDIEIAREVARAGLPAGMFMADGMHACRMYDSWGQFTRGWERIYIESCNRKPERLRQFATRVRVTGVWLPAAAVVCAIVGGLATRLAPGDPLPWISVGLGAGSIVAMLVSLMAAYRMSRTPLSGAGLYPLGAWLTGSIMRSAARTLERGGTTKWGGREYEIKAR